MVQAGGGASAVGRGTEAKAKAAETLKDLDAAMAEFCVRDAATGAVTMLHEVPALAQHRGKWVQVRTACPSCTITNLYRWTAQYYGGWDKIVGCWRCIALVSRYRYDHQRGTRICGPAAVRICSSLAVLGATRIRVCRAIVWRPCSALGH